MADDFVRVKGQVKATGGRIIVTALFLFPGDDRRLVAIMGAQMLDS
ncbi:hypothetical protein SCG7086_AA_00270 [Chlamydiales bacterium SCGC AG-110-P3]|nr:hypothetical protein SCG7086_AA_00270 [Chlamydiales bacterium SCGC AG-110-P3]